MLSIINLFEKAFKVMQSRNWEKIYVAVDIHETIVEPTWTTELSFNYYPFAKEALNLLSQRKDVYLIQWSSSNPFNNLAYHRQFAEHGINFDSINCNKDVASTDYADFDSKLYINVGLDDKFGFEPKDWKELYYYLILIAN